MCHTAAIDCHGDDSAVLLAMFLRNDFYEERIWVRQHVQ